MKELLVCKVGSMATQSHSMAGMAANTQNRASGPVDHAIGNLAALTYAHTPAREFNLGTPRRTAAILDNGSQRRLTAVQREYRDATIYYLRDADYRTAYQSHHSQRNPGDDNISFVLPKEGIIVVRVRNNSDNSSALSLENGTATISDTHHALLEEAVKHGLSALRGLTEGTIQRDIQERRERLREGRLVPANTGAIPGDTQCTGETLRIRSYTPDIAKRLVITDIQVKALTCHNRTIFLANQEDFEQLTATSSADPMVIATDQTRGEVLIINSESIPFEMPTIRSRILEETTAASTELVRHLEAIAIEHLTVDVRGRLGADSFDILLATLERHRVEPLSESQLVEALHDTARATALSRDEMIETALEALVYLESIDAAFIVNLESAILAFDTHSLLPADRTSNNSRSPQRATRRANVEARALPDGPARRIETAQRNGLDNIPANTQPIKALVDQVDRLGRDVTNSKAFIKELRRNAPAGVEIPQDCEATTQLHRNELGDPRGPYIQAEFDEFIVSITLADGTILDGATQVRWHTPTQTSQRELPGYRVTLFIGSDTYELTSIKALHDYRHVSVGDCFVSNANGRRSLFLREEEGPRELGALSDLGLIETQDGHVYSRSESRQTDRGLEYQAAIDATGKEVNRAARDIIKNLWHLPYIPERMDISV